MLLSFIAASTNRKRRICFVMSTANEKYVRVCVIVRQIIQRCSPSQELAFEHR